MSVIYTATCYTVHIHVQSEILICLNAFSIFFTNTNLENLRDSKLGATRARIGFDRWIRAVFLSAINYIWLNNASSAASN